MDGLGSWPALNKLLKFSLPSNNSTLNASWDMLVICLEQCQAHRRCSDIIIFIVKRT